MSAHLKTLGIDPATLGGMEPSAQFKQVRAHFLRAALEHHPDRAGGDPALFRAAHDAFESLKRGSGGGTRCLLSALSEDDALSGDAATHSADFYAECEIMPVPAYAVELAKTSRSACVVCTQKILKATPRFGSMNKDTGSYGRWAHLSCFRVPSIIHSNFEDASASFDETKAALFALDGLSLTGIAALSSEHIDDLIEAVIDRARWAKTTKKKRAEIDATKSAAGEPAAAAATPGQCAVVAGVGSGKVPEIVSGALNGQSFVLTGVFDAVGGVGMARGKAGITNMIAKAGGKCVGAVSKKTTFLVIGTLPGMSKVSKAQALGVPLITPAGLETLLAAGVDPEQADLDGVAFSKGFGGNGLANRLTCEPEAKRLCQ